MKPPNPEPPDAAPALETPRLSIEVQVMFFDTDCAAVVHNIAYLRFIETARTLLAEQLGMGLVEMARTQIYPVVVRTEIDYKKPAVLGRQARGAWLAGQHRSDALLVRLRDSPPL